MAQTHKLDHGAARTTANVNGRLLDIIKPGVYYGFYVEADGTDMTLNIVKNGDALHVLVTTEGVVVIETDDLPDAVTIQAPDPTNPRIDIVYAQHVHGPSNPDLDIDVEPGNPAVSPSPPPLPSNSIQLCQVAVAPGVGATVISQGDLSEQAHVKSPIQLPIQEDGTLEGKFNVLNVGNNLNLSIADGVGTISLDGSLGGSVYVQDDEPSSVAGGSNDIEIGDRWIDTDESPELTSYIAQSSWNAGDATDWLQTSYYNHAAEHESGGGDEVDATNLQNVGNSSGNVPISNGTLNTDLNADQLDGNDASDFASAAAYAAHDHSAGDPTQVTHSDILAPGANDHHNQQHALSGSDHTGDLAYTQVDGIVKTSGGGGSTDLSRSDHAHTGSDGSDQVAHSDLDPASVSSDQHHNQQHALSGSDHTGDLAYTQVDGIVKTSGGGGSTELSRSDHAHTGSDGSDQIAASNVSGFDAAAKSAAVDNTAYASSWDGVNDEAPSKNAVYDKINSIDAFDAVIKPGDDLEAALEDSSLKTIFIKNGTYSISVTSDPIQFSSGSKLVIGESKINTIIQLTGTSQVGTGNIILDDHHLLMNVKVDASSLSSVANDIVIRFDNSNQYSQCGCEHVWVVGNGAIDAFRSDDRTTHTMHLLYCHASDCTRGYYDLNNLTECKANDCTFGFSSCADIKGSEAYTTGAGGTMSGDGFEDCNLLVNCAVVDGAVGFRDCNYLSNCIADTCKAGFDNCDHVSSCEAINGDNHVYSSVSPIGGFLNCRYLSNCVANNSKVHGFYQCFMVSSCDARFNTDSPYGVGFYGCDMLSSCNSYSNIGGFYQCSLGAALSASSNTSYNYGVTNTNFNDSSTTFSVA